MHIQDISIFHGLFQCFPPVAPLASLGDGRVGCHGYSLLGNTSYATLAASHAPDAPAERPLVRAAVPAISFSRIQLLG